jgi:hypothetical protein
LNARHDRYEQPREADQPIFALAAVVFWTLIFWLALAMMA